MNEFTSLLNDVISSAPFKGSQRALARAIDINHTHLNRVLAGERDFSPKVVGRIARLLPEKQARALIKAYLQEIAEEIAKNAGREAVAIQ